MNIAPATAVTMSFDELVAANCCECGVDLDEHAPLPKPKPMGGWEPSSILSQPWRNTLTGRPRTEREAAYAARQRARGRISGSPLRVRSW